MTQKQPWVVYIIEADDNSLYTGITNNLEARFKAHCDGSGAKYFRGRQPKSIAFVEACENRSEASKREITIKRLTRKQKLDLIRSQNCTESAIILKLSSSE